MDFSDIWIVLEGCYTNICYLPQNFDNAQQYHCVDLTFSDKRVSQTPNCNDSDNNYHVKTIINRICILFIHYIVWIYQDRQDKLHSKCPVIHADYFYILFGFNWTFHYISITPEVVLKQTFESSVCHFTHLGVCESAHWTTEHGILL